MKVSVVMAVYNRAKYIGECVDSILAQKFQDFEIIVADDCSKDNTLEILNGYALKDKRIHIIANQHHHFIETLNMGMDMAKGEYIARIDSDDLMMPERLEKQVEVLDRDVSVTVCCSWYDILGDSLPGWKDISGKIVRPYHRLLLGNFMANPTSMIRKSFLDEYHLSYDEKYIFSEDYKLWTEIARLGGGFYMIPDSLVKYRVHEDQLSYKYGAVQAESAFKAQIDVLNGLVERHSLTDSRFDDLFTILTSFNDDGQLSSDTIFRICYELVENQSRLSQKKV